MLPKGRPVITLHVPRTDARQWRRGALCTVALLGALALAPALAQAAIIGAGAPSAAGSVTVGQAGIPGSITLTNVNTPPDQGATNAVCNAAAVAPCLGAGERGIQLIPSCGAASGSNCAPGNADPGVFAVSPTASGRLGTACSGVAFSVSVGDPATGAMRFTPQPAGTRVMLPGAGASCIIDFTQAALRAPAVDARPADPGIQTLQVLGHTQTSGVASSHGTGTTAVTVLAATASLRTTASGSVPAGGALTDTAVVSGLIDPVAGGTVTFRLYGPASGPTCAGAPVFTSTNTAQLAGTTAAATSGPFVATAVGTYRWVATYDGDAHNLPVSGTCGDAGEAVEVTPPGGGVPATPPFPAKLEVARGLVDRGARRLSVLAPITSRASGRVTVQLRAAGRTVTFTAPVDSAHSRIRINRRIPVAQANLGTGILTITYPGDADTQPQEVRLRAAPRQALLVAGRPTITGGRLTASGRISSRARGVVRVQVLFEPAGQATRTLQFTAAIEGGRYSLSQVLPPAVLAEMLTRRGVIHSYTLFTGYALARMRGEMASFQVLGAP